MQDSGVPRDGNRPTMKQVAVVIVIVELMSAVIRATVLPGSPRNITPAVDAATGRKLGKLRRRGEPNWPGARCQQKKEGTRQDETGHRFLV